MNSFVNSLLNLLTSMSLKFGCVYTSDICSNNNGPLALPFIPSKLLLLTLTGYCSSQVHSAVQTQRVPSHIHNIALSAHEGTFLYPNESIV